MLIRSWKQNGLKIEKCESGSKKSLPVRTSSFDGSPRVPEMQTIYSAIMPLGAVNKGPKVIQYQIHYEKVAEKYPGWENANKYKTVNTGNRKPKKMSKSREEKKKSVPRALASGEVDTEAEIAQKFVSAELEYQEVFHNTISLDFKLNLSLSFL